MGPRRLSAARRASPADAAPVCPALAGRDFCNSGLRRWVYSTARYGLLIRIKVMGGHERRPCPGVRLCGLARDTFEELEAPAWLAAGAASMDGLLTSCSDIVRFC